MLIPVSDMERDGRILFCADVTNGPPEQPFSVSLVLIRLVYDQIVNFRSVTADTSNDPVMSQQEENVICLFL